MRWESSLLGECWEEAKEGKGALAFGLQLRRGGCLLSCVAVPVCLCVRCGGGGWWIGEHGQTPRACMLLLPLLRLDTQHRD